MIHSDFHIHSEYSYDASLTLDRIAQYAQEKELCRVGITDHVNYNDEKFIGDLHRSAAAVKEAREKYPFMVLGVELTPIEKPLFDYIAKTGTRDGYAAPSQSEPYDIELPVTKEELTALGVRYAIGAAHWRVDAPLDANSHNDLDACIKEWYRQQMYLACDARVTVLGHPWYHGRGIWYEDFSVIPHSMHMDIAAALKENGKYVECNGSFFFSEKATEKFRHQYAAFLREYFEMGIPVTFGSDAHNRYGIGHAETKSYLAAAGFKDGDLAVLSEDSLW